MTSARSFIPGFFVLLWATGFIGARYAMPWAEPFSFLAVRFVLAFAILAVLVLVLPGRPIGVRGAAHGFFAGVLMHGVYLGGVFWAIKHGMPAGFSALIVGLQPLLTAVMAGSLLGETIKPRHWAGLAAGFVGIVIVLWPKLGVAIGGVTGPTLAAAIVAVIGMSAGTIWQKRFSGNADLVRNALYQYLGGAVVTAIAAFALETGTYTLNGELVFAMVWLVLVLSIGAIFLLMVMIREGEMSKVASLFYLVPAVTAVIAWLLFDEQLNLIQIVGMAIATLGVGLATAQAPTRARASR